MSGSGNTRATRLVAWIYGRIACGRLLAGRVTRRMGPSLALCVVLLSGLLGQLAATGIGMVPVAHAQGTGHPQNGANVFHPSNDHGGTRKTFPYEAHTVTALPPRDTTFHPKPVSMKPGDLALSATATSAAHFVGSDKRLEVSVPAGAVTAAVEKQAGGPVHLHVEELEGPSGGTDSGHVSLGTYAFTLQDGHGKKVAANLAKPLTLTLHLDGWRGAAFDLSRVQVIVNGGAPLSVFTGADGTTPKKVATSTVPATLNLKAATLTATVPLAGSGSGGTTSATWNTDSPQAQWSKQTDTAVDLPSGDLTYSYPIDVPAGQGGLAPKLSLTYDSAAVTGNHNPQATSGWLGEGWNLAVGSISWGEHNVYASCDYSGCTTGSSVKWEDSWQFSDAYGNSGELIPPNSNMTAWYDDTAPGLTAEPINAWHLDNSGAVRVISYTNPACNDLNSSGCNVWQKYFPLKASGKGNYASLPPCFRAFLPDGTIEEYGCTLESLQFYVSDNPFSPSYQTNYVYRWDLDAIIDPNGNQIQFGYQRVRNWDRAEPNIQFPIDAELGTITYDAPACHNRSTVCSGSNWNPAARIVFNANSAPARLVGPACPTFSSNLYYTPQTMRCDDVQDLSSSGGDGAPTLQSLLVLNDIQVQVTTTPNAPSWQTLRDYQLSYEQAPSTTSYGNPSAPVIDPNTNQSESVAGYLDLTKIQEVGDDGSTTLPPLSMGYTTVDEYYVDAMNPHAVSPPSTNCGPDFNATNCKLWAQSYNARYLSTLDNGRGWHETYSWLLARNNTHGVPVGQQAENPFACDSLSLSVQQSYPCNEADDENWSRVVLGQRVASVLCVEASGAGCGNGGTNTLSSTWTYMYYLADATAKECGDCTEDMYWGNNNDGDYLDFYNAHFMGFAFVNVTNPDGSISAYQYYATMGYGVATSSITCASFSGICDVDPWTNSSNALHGQLYQEFDYNTDQQTVLKTTKIAMGVTCPAPGVAASAYNTDATSQFVGQNSSELDINDPVVNCAVNGKTTDVWAEDGASQSAASHATTVDSYSYDGNGHLTQSSEDVTTNNAGATPHIVTRTQYAWDDAISVTSSSASGNYLAGVPAVQTTEDGSGNVKGCTYNAYDGATGSGATGQQNSLAHGLLTRQDRYATSCTPGSLSGQVSGTRAYDTSGNLLGVEDADALAGVSGHTDVAHCTIGGTAQSACASFDGLYDALPATIYNALDQSTTLNYTTDGSNTNSPDATNGWGTWLTTSTDANNAVTAYQYDALGRLVALAKPGDSLSSPTASYQYVDTCATTGASEPCVGLLATQQLSSGVTTTSATYYDGWGRPVETLTPRVYAGGTCTYSVTYTEYDAQGRTAFTSDAYFQSVTQPSCTPTGYLRPIVDSNHPGSSQSYDGLDRVTQAQDPIGNTTKTSYSVAAPSAGANVTDTAPYEATTVVDANNHQHVTLADGFGRTRYTETFTGNSPSTYALYGTSAQQYDWLGDVTSVTGPNPPPGAAGLSTSPQTTNTYDLLGRKTGMSDADLGNNWSFSYDANGNLLESVDPRGASSTVWHGYDGLNRELWRNTTNSSSGAYLTYSYDTATNGVGRVASEQFNTGASLGAGSYSYTYDARGQVLTETEVLDGSSYPFSFSYNDAGQPQSVTYSDGEVFALTYSAWGWLKSAQTTPNQGTAVPLVPLIQYQGLGGAAMKPTGGTLAGGTYRYSTSYDNDVRLTSASAVLASTSTTLYSTSRGYDGVGNVTSVQTTLAAGTDAQAFCYDEQNRLVWATSQTATGPNNCGASNTAGSLTSQGAQYTASYSYDALNRLTSSPLGTYTYGDPAHLHAATAAGSGYTASYDATGNMTCRAPASSATCAGGTPTGAGLGYTNEGQLTAWQNTLAGTPTTTAHAAYDGEGHRVASNVVQNGVTTSTTDYLAGGLEEVTTAGSTTTLTKYERVPGVCSIVIVGSGPSETISYVATDGLGSVSEALDGGGNVTAQQLYGPYGTGRFSLGSMPTSKGFTGQYGDATTGLDYYGARYYDPLVGQFTSADTDAKGGLNRYAYVRDDPETFTDPTGHRSDCQQFDECGGGGNGTSDGSGPPSSSGCADTCGCDKSCRRPPPPPPPSGCQTNCGGGKGPSGKSGGNAQPNPSSTSPTPKCDSICQAQDAAQKYSGMFGELADWLVVAGVALTTLAGVLAASIFGGGLAIFIVSFLVPLFAVLASEAALIGQQFANEVNFHVHDSTFWTLDGVGQYETTMLLELGSLNLAIAAAAKLMMGLPGLQEAITPIAGGFFAGAAIGETWFSTLVAQGFLQQDEALDAGQPPETATCDTRTCEHQVGG